MRKKLNLKFKNGLFDSASKGFYPLAARSHTKTFFLNVWSEKKVDET